MTFKLGTIDAISAMICGNDNSGELFKYRTTTQLNKFFWDCGTDYRHDGSIRAVWVSNVLIEILSEPQLTPFSPGDTFSRVIDILMDQVDACNEPADRQNALSLLNAALAREGYEAFYAEDRRCYLRHIETNTIAAKPPNPHRPFSQLEIVRRSELSTYLNNCSEDELTEAILLPLFRQLGFHRVTASGHKDKSLEYGKDIWMKYTLPTQHVLYFGIQVKKAKLDSSAASRGKNTNIAEIHNQALMMIGNEIFDHDIGKRVLVDHAFIVSGGEITKAAKNWLGNQLDAAKRSQIMFMDRDDILNLFVVTKVPLPNNDENVDDGSLPF